MPEGTKIYCVLRVTLHTCILRYMSPCTCIHQYTQELTEWGNAEYWWHYQFFSSYSPDMLLLNRSQSNDWLLSRLVENLSWSSAAANGWQLRIPAEESTERNPLSALVVWMGESAYTGWLKRVIYGQPYSKQLGQQLLIERRRSRSTLVIFSPPVNMFSIRTSLTGPQYWPSLSLPELCCTWGLHKANIKSMLGSCT